MVFTFVIFVNHSATLINPNENVTTYMTFGFLGVEFFFILSGYLMAVKADKVWNVETGPSTLKYLYGKLVNFYPYFLIAWIMAMIVDSIGRTCKNILINILKSLPVLLQVNLAGFRGYQVMGTSWYLSAMMLSILILYPLLLRYRKTFTLLLAPIVCIFSYGYLFLKVGNLATVETLENSGLNTGILRGVAGISLGCICYEGSNFLSKLPFNKKGDNVMAFIEVAAFGSAVFFEQTKVGFRPDFLFVCLVAIGVMSGFCSHNSLNIEMKNNYTWIGKFSLCFYLSDSIARSIILILLPEATRDQRLAPALGLAIILAVTIQFLGGKLVKYGEKISVWIRSTLLYD